MDSLADKINLKPGRGNRPYPPGVKWSMTECIGCPAEPLHRALGCPMPEFDASTLSLFHEGFLHEDDIKARIRATGEEIIDFPNGLVALDIPVVAHPDGWMPSRNVILETKSLGGEEPETELFIAQHARYVRQVMSYENIANIPKGIIITKMRDSGWIMPDMVIEHDPKVTKPIWENVKRIEQILQTNPSSCAGPWYPTCSTDFRTRLFCPFNGSHCVTNESQITSELEGLLSDYGTNKIVLDLLNARVESIRESIEALMAEGGLRRQRSSEGVLASMMAKKYPKADKELARELLPPDVYGKIFSETSSTSLRITIPKKLREGVVLPWN